MCFHEHYVYQVVLQILMSVLALLTCVMLCLCRWWTWHYQTMMLKVRGLILLMNLLNTWMRMASSKMVSWMIWAKNDDGVLEWWLGGALSSLFSCLNLDVLWKNEKPWFLVQPLFYTNNWYSTFILIGLLMWYLHFPVSDNNSIRSWIFFRSESSSLCNQLVFWDFKCLMIVNVLFWIHGAAEPI